MGMEENTAKVIAIIKKHPIGMLTTTNVHGELMCRPMTVMQAQDDGELWFLSSDASAPANDVKERPEVGLSFSGSGEWLSLRGSAVVIKNEPKARDLWNEAAQAFFPDGPESKDVVLIRIRPDGGEYWTSPGGVVQTAFQWAKARITGEAIDAGDSRTVRF